MTDRAIASTPPWAPGRPRRLAVAALLAAAAAGGAAIPAPALADEPFERVKVFMERNLQDKDAEVKFEVTSGKAGLATLKVVAPDGRTVVDFKAPDSRLGQRHLALESPEPANDGQVQADFPAGTYRFSGLSTTGARLEGKATLSHGFPAAANLVRPRPDAANVPVKGLTIAWTVAKGLDAVIVVIVDEKTRREVTARLPGNSAGFTVPAGFLQPATDYKLEIGSVAPDGNKTYIESGFTTAAR